MARQSQIKFTIPEPCNVPWKGMTSVDTDQRYCSSCDKVITNFSKMTDDELMLFFRHSGGNACGRFLKTQLNRPMMLLPEKTVSAKWWRTLILIPLTLFGKQAKAQFVEVVKQIQTPDTAAIVLQKDSLKNDSIAKEKIASNDSVQPRVDSLKLTITKPDSTYQYVWKPTCVWTYPDSLYSLIDIFTMGGVPMIVTMPQPIVWVVPYISVPYPLGPNPVSDDWIGRGDPFYIKPDPAPKSILTILLDTIVPFRKKKRVIHSVAKNSEKVEMKDPLKEISDKPQEKPKPPQPALPASNDITAIMPAERRKWWRS